MNASFTGRNFDCRCEVELPGSLRVGDSIFLLVEGDRGSEGGYAIHGACREPREGYSRFVVEMVHKRDRFGVTERSLGPRISLPSLIPFLSRWIDEEELREREYHLYELPASGLSPDNPASRWAAACRRLSRAFQ